jgi:hypothetical protein
MITYESKGTLKKINPYNINYPRCIPYAYWQRAVGNGADIVLEKYTIGNVNGSIRENLRDGYRSNDYILGGRLTGKFDFLNPEKEEENEEKAPLPLVDIIEERVINIQQQVRRNADAMVRERPREQARLWRALADE